MLLINKEKIFRGVVESLLEKGKLNYSKLYAAVADKTRNKVSHRDFSACLKEMVGQNTGQNILHKDDSTVRGKPVEYSLTKKALRQSTLKILGIDAKVEWRKHLYKLLLFYESYKRRPLLSEKQLHFFLKKIGCAENNLEQIGYIPSAENIVTVFKPIKGLGILRLDESKTKPGFYYIVTPGFSAEEFIKYLRILKRGKDPRPFSSTSSFVPLSVHLVDYTKEEVVDAIESFVQEGLIKPTAPIIPGETRYKIANDSFLGFIHSIWFIRMIDYNLLIARLIYGGKPTPEDKKNLSLFVDKKNLDKVIALTSQKKENYKNKKRMRSYFDKISDYRKSAIQEITRIYGKVIRENEVAAELLQEICLSPFI